MGNITAVEWYAIEHRNLLIQLENKELTIGEYVVKHHDILQKAKSIEDLNNLKKRDSELQEHILSNNTNNEIVDKQSSIGWLANNYHLVTWLRNRDEISRETADLLRKNYLKKAKRMHEKEMFEAFKAGQDSMEEGGKSFDIYYKQTYGKANGS